MNKLIIRLFVLIVSLYLIGSVCPLLATVGGHGSAPAPSAPPPPAPGPPASAPQLGGGTGGPSAPPTLGSSGGGGGCGGGGYSGAGPSAPPPPETTTAKPAGYMSDGRPYYGSGTRNDPYRDYPNVNQPSYGTTFGSGPPPGATPPTTTAAAPSTTTTKTTTTERAEPKKPDTTKTKTTKKEPTQLESMNKSWEFWQSQYSSWENDRVASKEQCERNMKEAAEKIAQLKRDYARLGKTPPSADRTSTTYPPQTQGQQRALKTYQEYVKAMNELRQAEYDLGIAKNRAGVDAITSIGASPNDPRLKSEMEANRKNIDAADRAVNKARDRVNKIQSHWRDSGNQAKYGSLPSQKTTAPDPTYQPKDPRKQGGRTVDTMEHNIKSKP
jgi:hypothetical protein